MACICVIPVLNHNALCGNKVKLTDDHVADLLYGLSEDGTFQRLLRDTVFNHFGCYEFRDIIQGILVLLVALMSCDKGFLLVLDSFMVRDEPCLVEQKASVGCLRPLSFLWMRRNACAMPDTVLTLVS